MIELRDEFLKNDNELTDDQLEQLIEEKFLRAKQYYEVLLKREDGILNRFE